MTDVKMEITDLVELSAVVFADLEKARFLHRFAWVSYHAQKRVWFFWKPNLENLQKRYDETFDHTAAFSDEGRYLYNKLKEYLDRYLDDYMNSKSDGYVYVPRSTFDMLPYDENYFDVENNIYESSGQAEEE